VNIEIGLQMKAIEKFTWSKTEISRKSQKTSCEISQIIQAANRKQARLKVFCIAKL